MKTEQMKKEVRIYPYEHIMMDDDLGGVVIFTNPKYHPDDHYRGQGLYHNWSMESYSHEKFAMQMLFGLIKVTDVPQQIWVHEIQKMLKWQKVERLYETYEKRGNITVEKCPHCGSKNIEYDGDMETDGCSADWATWAYWSINCNDCDDFSLSGKYVESYGGNW